MSVAPFSLFGPVEPVWPLVISVPHAGRCYPEIMMTAARLSTAMLRPLEDRFADALVGQAIADGVQAVVANTARAWIDLNRSELECDPALIDLPGGITPLLSAKVRGGLGLIPRRIASGGDVWHQRIESADLIERIERHHRPYHQALDGLLSAVWRRFGTAILLDVHSMPTLPASDSGAGVHIVIGDDFGRAAHDRFTARAKAAAEQHGLDAAINHPYAGGHILRKHSRPHRGRHAIQIEIDRSLYLDSAGEPRPADVEAVGRFVARLAFALIEEAREQPLAVAAE